jgi:NADH:ubiquinone oxidoreductase subunit F (NADH-binding)
MNAAPGAPGGTRRLLLGVGAEQMTHEDRHGPLPHVPLETLLSTLADSGLTGRGGGGFPSVKKLRAVTSGSRKPVVVGNGLEGEPLSSKDAVLLDHSPHLVLDGLEVLARAARAKKAVLALGPDIDPAPVLDAGRGRRVEVVRVAGGFVAGQESALVNQLNGRPAMPSDPFTRVTESGIDGRPTLVLNVETLAQLALVVRHGPAWFRSSGTSDDPGTSLFTISGAVRRPGVVEAPRGMPVRDVLAPAEPEAASAVLVGGYHGAWVPASALDTPLTARGLAGYNASVGAGVLHVLETSACPLVFAAEVVDYLAGESAAQCGPCLNGLPHLARNLHRLAARVRDPAIAVELTRMSRLVTGRGACAHPDGSARFVASTLAVFRDHVAAHLQGWCPAEPRRAAS